MRKLGLRPIYHNLPSGSSNISTRSTLWKSAGRDPIISQTENKGASSLRRYFAEEGAGFHENVGNPWRSEGGGGKLRFLCDLAPKPACPLKPIRGRHVHPLNSARVKRGIISPPVDRIRKFRHFRTKRHMYRVWRNGKIPLRAPRVSACDNSAVWARERFFRPFDIRCPAW